MALARNVEPFSRRRLKTSSKDHPGLLARFRSRRYCANDVYFRQVGNLPRALAPRPAACNDPRDHLGSELAVGKSGAGLRVRSVVLTVQKMQLAVVCPPPSHGLVARPDRQRCLCYVQHLRFVRSLLITTVISGLSA